MRLTPSSSVLRSLLSGVEAQSEAIGKFLAAFPEARVLHGAADAHHGYVRFRWQTDLGDGSAPFLGEDVTELDAEGRILRLVSFDGSPAEVNV